MRTLSGTVTSLTVVRDVTLNGENVVAGTVLGKDAPALKGCKIDALLAKNILKVTDRELPLRENKATRPFHVTPGDYENMLSQAQIDEMH